MMRLTRGSVFCLEWGRLSPRSSPQHFPSPSAHFHLTFNPDLARDGPHPPVNALHRLSSLSSHPLVFPPLSPHLIEDHAAQRFGFDVSSFQSHPEHLPGANEDLKQTTHLCTKHICHFFGSNFLALNLYQATPASGPRPT